MGLCVGLRMGRGMDMGMGSIKDPHVYMQMHIQVSVYVQGSDAHGQALMGPGAGPKCSEMERQTWVQQVHARLHARSGRHYPQQSALKSAWTFSSGRGQ